MSTITDAELVTAYLAGDRSALAGIYDRYGATLYDTAAAMTNDRHDAADIVQDVIVVAAERLGQLRDPTRLKPWLFAILRNEVYRRTGRKRRTVATDFTEPVAEMTLPTDDADSTAGADFEELAALVRAAAGGLDERDQLVLELSLRQDLDGTDLADALGVTPQQSYNLVHRMRQRTERSLAAYCVARRGRKDCPELAEILRGWDEQFTVLIRKRVARHIDACDICERARRALAPLALFAGAPAFAVPAGLRDRVLAATINVSPSATPTAGGAASYGFARPGGFPSALRHARKLALAVLAGVAALILVMGTTVYVLADSDDDAAIATVTPTTASGDDGRPVGDEADEADDAESDGAAADDDEGADEPPAAEDPSTNALPPSAPSSTTSSSTSSTSSTSTSTPASTGSTTAPTSAIPSTTLAPLTPAITTTVPTPAPPPPTTTVAPATTTTAPPPPPPPPPPAALGLSSSAIDFGTASSSATVALSNTGGSPANWSATSGPLTLRGAGSPFALNPSVGVLQPGQSVVVVVTFDRSWPVEGARAQRVTFSGGGASASIDLSGMIGRPPVLRVSSPASAATHCPIDLATQRPRPLPISVSVVDESMPPSGVFSATLGGSSLAVTLTERSGTLVGSSALDRNGDGVPDVGTWTWQINVSDALGNTTRVQGTVDVQTFHCR